MNSRLYTGRVSSSVTSEVSKRVSDIDFECKFHMTLLEKLKTVFWSFFLTCPRFEQICHYNLISEPALSSALIWITERFVMQTVEVV